MAYQNGNTLVMEVLTVASPSVLGKTISLEVDSPCKFKNAKGDLREVDDFAAISKMARASAARFSAALKHLS